MKLRIGSMCCICIFLSIFVSFILCSYYNTIPIIKKNILTHMDELFVLNFTFFVCSQCSVCLLSLMCEARNDFFYLAFFILVYGSLTLSSGILLLLSFCRVFIIIWVSINLYMSVLFFWKFKVISLFVHLFIHYFFIFFYH